MYNGRSDEGGENGDGEEGSNISREGKRVKITWPHVYRGIDFVWWVGDLRRRDTFRACLGISILGMF